MIGKAEAEAEAAPRGLRARLVGEGEGEVKAEETFSQFIGIDGAVVIFVEFFEQFTNINSRVCDPLSQDVDNVIGYE